MRVLVLTTQCAFVSGGAELHALGLLDALRREGVLAEVVTIPFLGATQRDTLDAMRACRLLDVRQTALGPIDRVIGLKFPAYLIPHPNKVLWVLHQHRMNYDLFETPYGFASHPGGHELQGLIRDEETAGLREARKIFANSRNVAHRLEKYSGIQAEPLYHPPAHAESFKPGEAEDFFFFPSRLSALKRQALALEALALTRAPVKMIFAGAADSEQFREELESKILKLGLGDRVEYLGFVDDRKRIELFSRCRAVIFPPFDEDLGYVTLEAQLSGKPVVTCADSGGPLEFVRHRENGWVAEATPASLADAMDTLWADRSLCESLGRNGLQFYRGLQLDWRKVVSALLA